MLTVTLEPQLLKEHQKAVVSVKYSPSGDLIASACADKRAYVYSSSGQLKNTLDRHGDCHTAGLNDCCWCTESYLATASDDGTVKLWDVSNGQVMCSFRAPHNTFVHSLCCDEQSKLIYAGTFDGQVCCFAAQSPEPVATFRAHGDAVISMEMRSTGSSALSLMTGGQESLVRLWDSRSMGYCLSTVVVTDCCDGSRSPLSCASFSTDGKRLLTSTLDDTHRLFDMKNMLSSSGGRVSSVQPKLCTGHQNRRFCVPSRIIDNYHCSAIISGSEDGSIYFWDVDAEHPEPVRRITDAHSGAVLALDFHPSYSKLQFVSGSTDGTLHLWHHKLDPS